MSQLQNYTIWDSVMQFPNWNPREFVHILWPTTNQHSFCSCTAFQKAGSATPKALVTVFLDGREILKKMHRLNTTAEILDACKSSLTFNAECDSLKIQHRFFNEFIWHWYQQLCPKLRKISNYVQVNRAEWTTEAACMYVYTKCLCASWGWHSEAAIGLIEMKNNQGRY